MSCPLCFFNTYMNAVMMKEAKTGMRENFGAGEEKEIACLLI